MGDRRRGLRAEAARARRTAQVGGRWRARCARAARDACRRHVSLTALDDDDSTPSSRSPRAAPPQRTRRAASAPGHLQLVSDALLPPLRRRPRDRLHLRDGHQPLTPAHRRGARAAAGAAVREDGVAEVRVRAARRSRCARAPSSSTSTSATSRSRRSRCRRCARRSTPSTRSDGVGGAADAAGGAAAAQQGHRAQGAAAAPRRRPAAPRRDARRRLREAEVDKLPRVNDLQAARLLEAVDGRRDAPLPVVDARAFCVTDLLVRVSDADRV